MAIFYLVLHVSVAPKLCLFVLLLPTGSDTIAMLASSDD